MELIIVKQGGIAQGTWIHRKIAYHLAMWVHPPFAVCVSNWLDELFTTGSVKIEKPLLPILDRTTMIWRRKGSKRSAIHCCIRTSLFSIWPTSGMVVWSRSDQVIVGYVRGSRSMSLANLSILNSDSSPAFPSVVVVSRRPSTVSWTSIGIPTTSKKKSTSQSILSRISSTWSGSCSKNMICAFRSKSSVKRLLI